MKVAALFPRLYMDWELQGRRSIRQMSNSARAVTDGLGQKDALKLSADDVRAYILERRKAGKANATINRELATLKRAYALALRDQVIKRIPPFPEKLKEENVRQGTYTRAEAERLWAELPPVLADMARYAYFTGRRRGEIAQLQWQDVDFDRRLITVRQKTTKNGEPDQIPLEGELYDLLLRLHGERTCDRVFHRRGKPIGEFTVTFARAAKRAGLDGRVFHDFRRTVATDLINAGVDQATAMRVTGHRTATTFQRYRIVNPETVREAQAKLAEHRNGGPKNGSRGARLAKARQLWPELP